MERSRYSPVDQVSLAGTSCYVLDAENPPTVRADSPALDVMTDLAKIPAATIGPDDLLSDANQSMLLRGVRLLLVVTEDDILCGVITAADLLGEKPVLVAQNRGLMRFELRVGDVMTPLEDMQALRLEQVAHMQVGHIVETLKAAVRVHALVLEAANTQQVVRGIFSASQIARQLGIRLIGHDAARIFAEIEASIAGV